jgi:hypothetical protein
MIKTIKIQKKVEVKKDVSSNLNIFNSNEQISMINQMYLGEKFKDDKLIRKNLKQKINSYKQQDLRKDRYDSNTFIKYDELLEKLVISKLICGYCKCRVLLMYANKREDKQWTLDRINNDDGHSNSNTIISCLKCNLERRCKNDKKFLFSKQMRLIKKN